MYANLSAAVAITASSGDQTIIAAPSGANAQRRIAVVGFHIQVDGTTNLTLKSGSTAMAGPAPQVAGDGWVYPLGSDPSGKNYWFVCNPGEALVLNLSSSATAGGIVVYRLIG